MRAWVKKHTHALTFYGDNLPVLLSIMSVAENVAGEATPPPVPLPLSSSAGYATACWVPGFGVGRICTVLGGIGLLY